MDQQQMFMMLPGLEPGEMQLLQSVMNEMSPAQQQQFISFYQGKRKDQQTLMIMTLIGFLGIAGIHRFVIGDIGLGILYLFTGGFCGIATIIDLINIKSITNNYNQKQIMESAGMVRLMGR